MVLRPLLIAILALTLAACGQLPRPFAPDETTGAGLLELKDRAGITVLPMAGDAPEPRGSFARIMIEALQALNVPAAMSRGNRESRILQSRALVLPLPDGRDELLLYWDLRGPGGERAGLHSLRRVLPRGVWLNGDPGTIGRLAAETAPVLAAMVQNPPVKTALIPGFPGARLVVLPLDKGPGDAALSLPRALEAELMAASLPVTKEIGDDDLLVLGSVTLGAPKDGFQEVAIEWRVIHAGSDEELGEVAQRNQVPAGSLDGPWGPTARAVARAAAAGVIDLLDRAGKL